MKFLELMIFGFVMFVMGFSFYHFQVAKPVKKELESSKDDYTVAYICDQKACTACNISTDRECYYTTDIRHAKHFMKVGPEKYMEIYTIPELKVNWEESE